jgi:hypothetical protein
MNDISVKLALSVVKSGNGVYTLGAAKNKTFAIEGLQGKSCVRNQTPVLGSHGGFKSGLLLTS